MEVSTPNELVTVLRSEVARYRLLIEHAEGYIAAIEGRSPVVTPEPKMAPLAVSTPPFVKRPNTTATRRSMSGAKKSVHNVIMPGSHAAMCQQALQAAGRPLHVNDLYDYCKRNGATVKQPSYLQSALYRHKHAFAYTGNGMWTLASANGSISEQLPLNGNNTHS